MPDDSPYIGVIDQGTTGTRFVIFDRKGGVVGDGFEAHARRTEPPNRVEYDPAEIWACVRAAIQRGLRIADIEPGRLTALGIANQRQTVVLWNARSGKPITPAISWQDRRAQPVIDGLTTDQRTLIRKQTGLVPDAYFAGPRFAWLLEQTETRRGSLKRRATRGEVRGGTIDTWLLSKLTDRHLTDITNAAQTMLVDVEAQRWDEEILEVFDIPRELLPSIHASSHPEVYGRTDIGGLLDTEIPITGVIGNQQAALAGHGGFEPGATKVSYGAGNFALQHVGTDRPHAEGLLSTIWFQQAGESPLFGLEGPVFSTGTMLEWLETVGLGGDGVNMIPEGTSSGAIDPEGPVVVPAFTGLGAPDWFDTDGAVIAGLSPYTDGQDIVDATVNGIGFATRATVETMAAASGFETAEICVDGGAIDDDRFVARQASLLDARLLRPEVTQASALGAALAAGIGVGIWASPQAFGDHWELDRTFEPSPEGEVEPAYHRWKRVVERNAQ